MYLVFLPAMVRLEIVVPKAVLKAVTSENPSMRYLAGDVEKRMESKRSMSDEEFHKMMKQNMMK
jgi:hypothetical protein